LGSGEDEDQDKRGMIPSNPAFAKNAKVGHPPKPRSLPFLLVLATACPTFAFAFWTVVSHVAVAAHLSFQTLARIGPFALMAGIACGIFAARAGKSGWNSQSVASLQRPGWPWLAIAAGIVALHALGVAYQAFWIVSVLLLISGLAKLGRASAFADEEPAALTPRGTVILVLLALASAGITYVAHHPNIDDAVYVGTATDAVAHPELPVLSHDMLYGGQKLPLMLPSYAVESYALLIAFFARLFGGEPIFWAHAIVPTFVAAILPLAWASLMRALAPRHWVAATALALVLLALPGLPRGLGNFAFVGLFAGKAILVSIGIPLLYAFAWKFEETGSVWDWFLLASSTIACVGLSSTAIFVAPVALATASLAGWREGLTRRAALTFLPAAYPLSCGLVVGGGFKALDAVFAYLPARASLAVAMVFSEHGQYLFLFALLSAPFLVRDSRLRWKLILVVLLYFLVPLNPFTFKLLSRFTTREAAWRILWSVPVVGIATAAAVNAVEIAAEYWGKRGMVLAVLALLCCFAYLAPYSSFAPSGGISYSLSPLKVRVQDWETARDAIAVTPPATAVLAPEAVAVWIPTFVHRPPIVSVRAVYDEERGVRMPPDEARERRELRELVSGQELPPERMEALLSALPRYRVGLILTTTLAASRLQDALAEHGYSRTHEEAGYVFFVSAAPSISAVR
jgi:uncharacterized protein DUF6077